jgi:hypothetical protein
MSLIFTDDDKLVVSEDSVAGADDTIVAGAEGFVAAKQISQTPLNLPSPVLRTDVISRALAAAEKHGLHETKVLTFNKNTFCAHHFDMKTSGSYCLRNQPKHIALISSFRVKWLAVRHGFKRVSWQLRQLSRTGKQNCAILMTHPVRFKHPILWSTSLF